MIGNFNPKPDKSNPSPDKILKMREELNKIYGKVPGIDCIEGCADCCGFLPHFTEGTMMQGITNLYDKKLIAVEIANIRQFLRDNGMKLKTFTRIEEYCPYAGEGTCEIYPVRPLTCRVFGVLDVEQDIELQKGTFHHNMKCPYVTPEKYISKEYYEHLQKKVAGLYDKFLK